MGVYRSGRILGRAVVAAVAACVASASVALAQTPITYYLSEGATSTQFFNEDILIANPNNASAPVTLTFSTDGGQQIVANRIVPAQTHITVRVNDIPGLEQASASAQITSDNGLVLLVERTMFWDKSSYAGHTGSSVDQPSRDWFFAEGSQGSFDTYVLAINPNAAAVDITFTFLREGEPTVVKTLPLGPNTRLTLFAKDVPELVDRSFGMAVHATQPIMVERSMYWSIPTRVWSGGTESAGVKAPSTHWFLAEGATGSYFSTFVLLSNPQNAAAHVELKYLLDTGETVTIPKTIPAGARITTDIAAEPDARLVNAAMSTVVTSDVPIIAERSMYWKGAAPSLWGEGHNSFGVVDAGLDWGLAEGRNGGSLNFHTYILLANPNTTTAEVKVRYLRESGAAVVKTYTVGATSRFNIDTAELPELQNRSFGAVFHVTNGVKIVVERSMYWDVGGVQFSGGTNATGIPVPADVGALDPIDGGGGGREFPNTYPGFTYNLPATRPFISLADYAGVSKTSKPYTRLKGAVDRTIGGNEFYGYSAVHAVLMFKLTGDPKYINLAIATVEQLVTEAEADIASRGYPDLAGDSYLGVGWYIEQIALTYDYGYDRLTPQQRQRWVALADQAIYNVWNPNKAAWGGQLRTWTGWSINDPGNNYHYSFLRATMSWTLATQNQTWLAFLQAQKFPPLVTFFAAMPGGGTREGTGYGSALGNLFGNYIFWKSSTGEDLANLTAHTQDTIDYWVHATVPTRDRFAPIGDQSRVSVPDIYDYQHNLVHEAVVLAAGSAQAKRGTWWLKNNSLKDGVQSDFNLPGDLLPFPDAPVQPTDLVYRAEGTGAFFARTSWATDATWLEVLAGKYDQDHSHHDQGAFTFFKGDWLSVTSNIWSHSGIRTDDEAHNVLRFVRSNGSLVRQNTSSTLASSLTYTQNGDLGNGGTLQVTADLKNAYSANKTLVLGWTRNFELTGTKLRVHDVCSVAAGVTPVFQLHVPVQPSAPDTNGVITAGNLRIVRLKPANVAVVDMHQFDSDFNKGFRIDFTSTSGCEFDIELRAQ